MNVAEPKLPPAVAECPKALRGVARQEWERLAPGLVAAGMLTIADLTAFREYCLLTAEVRAMKGLVSRVGQATAHRLGYLNAHGKLRKELRAWAVELGLTSSSRSRVKASPTGVPDDTEEFLFGHRRSS